MSQFNVNTDNVIIFTNKLEKMHRYAFPVAVRQTLNSAAFDVKKRTIEKFANKSFIRRQKDFFKANSTVKMASGNDVKSMEAKVGFIPLKGTNKAVDDLEQQEEGGRIKGRSFVPLNTARKSNSYSNLVEAKNRIKKIKKVHRASRQKKQTKAQRFVSAAIKSGVGGVVIAENSIAYRVDKIYKKNKGKLKVTPVYKFKKKGSVKVKATHFMENASNDSGKRMERFYKYAALKQFRKYT